MLSASLNKTLPSFLSLLIHCSALIRICQLQQAVSGVKGANAEIVFSGMVHLQISGTDGLCLSVFTTRVMVVTHCFEWPMSCQLGLNVYISVSCLTDHFVVFEPFWCPTTKYASSEHILEGAKLTICIIYNKLVSGVWIANFLLTLHRLVFFYSFYFIL